MSKPAFELKRISADGIPQACERAQRYRLLNDPEQAESICHDILAVDSAHQETLRTLVLALTDQFTNSHAHGGTRNARAFVDQLSDEYDRAYYTGIVFEREARAFLSRPGAIRATAYGGFREAMEWYDRAALLRPHHNVEALLRWNSCVRTIEREHLEPPPREREPLLE